jgi:hypothetical protein
MGEANVVEEGVLVEGVACQPNISPAGVLRRRRFGAAGIVVAVAVTAGIVLGHARWPWVLVVFLPTLVAALSLFQARRKTCVARANEGTFEHDDFSKTPADAADVRRSRIVAGGIWRDSILVGLAATALAVLATRL